MLIKEITPPKSYKYFPVVKAFQVGEETREETLAFFDWIGKNLPRITPKDPSWTFVSFPHSRGPYSLKFYFSTEDLAKQFLSYWPGRELAA